MNSMLAEQNYYNQRRSHNKAGRNVRNTVWSGPIPSVWYFTSRRDIIIMVDPFEQQGVKTPHQDLQSGGLGQGASGSRNQTRLTFKRA